MKFKLKQEKMRDLLEKLSLQNLFPVSIIKASENEISSLQKEANGVGIRYARFKKSYFEEFEVEKDETIELDIQRTLNVIKKLDAKTPLTFETKGDKVVIKGERVSINLSYREPNKKDLIKKLPYENEETPSIKGISLSTTVTMKKSDLKEATEYGNSIGTEFYTLKTLGKKLQIRVGDLHRFSDFVLFKTDSIANENDAEAIYTIGLPQIANTFVEKELKIQYTSDAPAIISEKNEECSLIVLLPPQAKSGA